MKAKREPSRGELPTPAYFEGRTFMAADPGIGGTGLALFKEGQWNGSPSRTWVITAFSKTATWWNRALDIADTVGLLAEENRVTDLICECPQFFASAGGEMVAGRGDLVKLSIAAGAVAGAVQDRCTVHFVEVNMWKGQLKKPIVEKRIQRELGDHACRDFKTHAWDAVGIGLWAVGRFE